MQGLRAIIRNKLPLNWEIVLKQEKKLYAFIEYVYRDQPKCHKGKYGYPEGKRNIIIGYARCPIYMMFKAKNTKEGEQYWFSVYMKIKTLDDQCR